MNPQLSFGGTPLPPDESVKVLRRTFDSKLSYRLHLRQVASRAKQRLGLLRKAAPLLSHAGRVTVCKGFVRPMLEYAPLAWMGPAPSHLAMLDAVQLRALNVICHWPWYHTSQPHCSAKGLCSLPTRESYTRLPAAYCIN